MKINSVSVTVTQFLLFQTSQTSNLPDTKLQMFVDVERNNDKKRHGEYSFCFLTF